MSCDASTSFANPALTVARSLTDTVCGTRPDGIIDFVLAQLAAVGSIAVLSRKRKRYSVAAATDVPGNRATDLAATLAKDLPGVRDQLLRMDA